MSFDAETPDPPSLRGPQDPADYDAVDEPEEWTGDENRREALAEFLRAGAWDAAFDEWRDETFLDDDEFRVVTDLGLIDEFDFYWNESDADVGYLSPTLPADLPAPYRDELDRGDVQEIDDELDSLGRVASEVLENDYVHRGDDEFGFFADE